MSTSFLYEDGHGNYYDAEGNSAMDVDMEDDADELERLVTLSCYEQRNPGTFDPAKRRRRIKGKAAATEDVEKSVNATERPKRLVSAAAAAREVGVNTRTGQSWAKAYRDDPEKKVPMSKTDKKRGPKPTLLATEHKSHVINYIDENATASAAIPTVTQLEHFEQKRDEVFFCKSPFLFNMDSSGVNALKEYITGTKRARINATSAHGLHGAWIQQYDTIHMKVKNTEKRSPRTKLCNTALWNDIFENFKRRKNAIDTFHEEAISTLTTAARPAAREVRQLVDPVALNEESTQLRAPGRDRFQVDNIDISGKFYQMQQCVFDFVISNNLTLESDVHLILSLNSILLLQNNNRLYKAMVPFFGNKLYTRIREHNLDSWNSTSKFPGDVLLKIIAIAQSVYEKTTDRIGASVSILNMARTMNDKINKRLVVSASQLLQSLPMDPTNTDCDI
ncbi:hypothetical protein G6F62_005693 [Rhizopus arrhizus]|nr:hypothetical protein G6F62_005693 [Rhizopus arrhizus]